MNHGSLFSGIGGFDLAAEWMGWENVFHCEWNEFGQKVLHHYWPKAISYHDITKTDFTIHRGHIDILTGGFPCQPYSMAGKRKGKEDERHLWPEMLRAIREIQPRWVVGENVFGLVNWSGGLVFHEVQADLEAAGYEVWPYVLPAVSVNAPHRRDRIWFVAYSKCGGTPSDGCSGTVEGGGQAFVLPKNEGRESQTVQPVGLCGLGGDAADTNGDGHKGWATKSNSDEERQICQSEQNNGDGVWQSDDGCRNGVGDAADTKGNRNRGELRGLEEADGAFGQPKEHRQDNGKLRDVCGKRDAADTESQPGEWMRPELRKFSQQEQRESGGTHSQMGNNVTDTGSSRRLQNNEQHTPGESKYARPSWDTFPSQSPVCTGDDGLSSELDGITFSKWRNESIKAAGNAIVPQVVYQIFKAIEQYGHNNVQGR